MKVKFDSLNRFETPKFYLCNPGSVYNKTDKTISNVVGILPDTTDEEIVFNFNALSELSLRVPRVIRQNPEENQYAQKLYRAVQNRRLIFVEDVGFFVISNVSECYDGETHYKDVRAESCEVELQNRSMSYIPNGTYCLKDSSPTSGGYSSTLISMIESALPNWSFGEIDDSLDGRYRTFEDVSTDTNILSFVLGDVQDAYECLFVFDIENRIINVYDQAGYIHPTSIHITKDDIVTDLQVEEDASDLYTAITVLGCDNLSISSINPLGTNVIMNFDYYLDWMPNGLGKKVESWTDMLSSLTGSTSLYKQTLLEGTDYPVPPSINRDGDNLFSLYPYIIIWESDGITWCAMSSYPFYGADCVNESGVTSQQIIASVLSCAAEDSEGMYSDAPVLVYTLNDESWTAYDASVENYQPADNAHDLNTLLWSFCTDATEDSAPKIMWANHDIMLLDGSISDGTFSYLDCIRYHDGTSSSSSFNEVYFHGDRSAFITYYDISLQYYKLLTKRSELQSELEMYESRLDMYQRCYDNIIIDGDTACVGEYNEVIADSNGEISVADDIKGTLTMLAAQIASVTDECTKIRVDLETLDNHTAIVVANLGRIRDALAMSDYFSAEEYNELANYVFEGDYTDEFIAVTDIMTYDERFAQMKVLYDRAVEQLRKIAYPTQEFSANVENFIFSSKFQTWSEVLETGCLVNVELEQDDVAALFLTTISVNYHDHDLKLTFGNRYNRFDPKSLFTDTLGNIKKSANAIEYIKDVLSPITSGEFDAMKETLKNSRTLTKTAVLASANQEVTIDDTGYTGRKLKQDGSGEYEDEQVKLVNNALVFTSDDWETCHTALGSIVLADGETAYGLNAETIMGEMIIGGNLDILSMKDDGTTESLFQVMDGMIEAEVSATGTTGARISRLEQTADDLTLSFTSTTTEDGATRYSVNSVTTESNYTFNKDGLFIQKSDEDLINKIDNTGMYVILQSNSENEDNTTVLAANNKGVMALNLSSSQYLIVGESSRFEDYLIERSSTDEDGNVSTYTEKRTGCYFIENFTIDDAVTIEEV